ncbi:testis-specific gene 10 protein isoform X1 [Oncorhynchus kisutch]|uniref:Testis-specific gene 10 protein n=2 Tax=Oncorhynchus kisutch TaxID=8019 RepID=A0A8C7D551_ONCKI|nr:testis-specific gene 10 protein isoform X1 [Oncorhynchus kisutch]XP_031648564.1 testis-specific gene 10 protein isoform X1 [Oncorhynchus kisutch]
MSQDSESADTEPIELETQLNPTVEQNQEQDLQTLLDQLHQERDSLNRLVQKLSLTEREQVVFTEPGSSGKRGSRLDSFLRSVEEERDYYRQEADSLRRMLRGRCSCSPCRGHLQSRSPTRQSPVKGGSYDSELIRVLRERDEMQNMLDKYERHLSEIQANVKVLTADRDKTSMHYQQAQQEVASLRREVLKSKSSRAAKSSVTVPAQSILKRVEAERDEAKVDLHRMSTERDSLRERLKISQETAISERAHLEQRVEDLQTAILTLEHERGDQKSRLALMRESMMGLEEEVHTLGRKLTAAEDEQSRTRNECVMLRLSNSETQNALSDSQRRLTSRIGELQNSQERNKLLDEKNDSLLRQMSGLREEVSSLQSTITDLDQRRDSLQEQLENKTDLLNSAHNQLDDNEKTIRNLRLSIEDLETSAESVREELAGRERELEALRRRLGDAEEELGALAKVKDSILRENAQLQEKLDMSRLNNQALELNSEDSAQEVQELQRKVQDYVADISRIENLLSTKERECREHQEARRRASAQAESWEGQARQAEGSISELRLELMSSDMERRRLKEKVEALEASLQEALSTERSCSSQVSQLNRSLLHTEEQLRQTQGEHTATQTDLEKTRELCVKLDSSKEAMHCELELLRKQLSSERLSMKSLESMLLSTREKELHRQLSSQERHTEIQLLRDKLTAADSKASSQHREVATLSTRSAQLEADLDMTKRQLSTERFERERAVQELRRQGLSSSSSGLHPSSPHLRRSLSPSRPLWSTPDHLARERSPERSLGFKDLYD